MDPLTSAAIGAAAGAAGKALFDRLHARRQDKLAMGGTVARLIMLESDWAVCLQRFNALAAGKSEEEFYEIRAEVLRLLLEQPSFKDPDKVIDSLGRWWPLDASDFGKALQNIASASKVNPAQGLNPAQRKALDFQVGQSVNTITAILERALRQASKKHSFLTWREVKKQLKERQQRMDDLPFSGRKAQPLPPQGTEGK
jgi:hypothetical protein